MKRVCLLHIGDHVAAIYAEGHVFRVFVNGKYHRSLFDLDSAREYAIKVLSIMDSGLSDE